MLQKTWIIPGFLAVSIAKILCYYLAKTDLFFYSFFRRLVRKQKKKELAWEDIKNNFFLVLIWWKVCIANVPFLCPGKNDLFGTLRQFLDTGSPEEGWKGGGAIAPQVFGRLVNPIPNMRAHYAHYINIPPPDFWLCVLSRWQWHQCLPTFNLRPILWVWFVYYLGLGKGGLIQGPLNRPSRLSLGNLKKYLQFSPAWK